MQHPAEGSRPRVDPSGLAEIWVSGTFSSAPPTLPETTPVAIRSLVKSGEGKCK